MHERISEGATVVAVERAAAARHAGKPRTEILQLVAMNQFPRQADGNNSSFFSPWGAKYSHAFS
jgi:hypothetical protein